MISKEEMIQFHNRRITRAGEALWGFCKTMSMEMISGEMALNLMNAYGLEAKDVMFLCASHGCDLDIDKFYELLCQQEEIIKKLVKADLK